MNHLTDNQKHFIRHFREQKILAKAYKSSGISCGWVRREREKSNDFDNAVIEVIRSFVNEKVKESNLSKQAERDIFLDRFRESGNVRASANSIGKHSKWPDNQAGIDYDFAVRYNEIRLYWIKQGHKRLIRVQREQEIKEGLIKKKPYDKGHYNVSECPQCGSTNLAAYFVRNDRKNLCHKCLWQKAAAVLRLWNGQEPRQKKEINAKRQWVNA